MEPKLSGLIGAVQSGRGLLFGNFCGSIYALVFKSLRPGEFSRKVLSILLSNKEQKMFAANDIAVLVDKCLSFSLRRGVRVDCL